MGSSARPPKATTGEKRQPGRPPALTPEIHREIIEAVEELGMAESRAGMAAGFSSNAVYIWKTRGQAALTKWAKLSPKSQEEERPYKEFFEALRDAEYKFERSNLKTIRNADKNGDWRASRERLVMRLPGQYGRSLTHRGDPSAPIPMVAMAGAVLILPDNGRGDGPKPAAKPKAKKKSKPASKQATKPKGTTRGKPGPNQAD